MKTLHYAGDQLATGSDIADAVVAYAQALATHEESAAVDIPVRLDDGTTRQVSFLLGPASQLVAVPSIPDADDPEIEDVALIERITLAIARLGSSRAEPFAVGERLPEDDYDF